jgi:hypothetical protein
MQTDAPALPSPHVLLPEGESGTDVFHRALLRATERFEGLAQAGIPTDGRAFRKTLPEAIVRFEALRCAIPERIDVARHLTETLLASLHFGHPDGSDRTPLAAHLAAARPDPKLARIHGTATAGWHPDVTFRGVRYAGAEVGKLVDLLRAEHAITASAADGMRWALARLDRADRDGRLVLTGERFALLGAQAELAPTRLLLEAGAEVLWVDRVAPSALAAAPSTFAGTLVTADASGDLIASPADVMATLRAFAGDDRVHMGLFAYAPGRGRELRLAATMDALVRALGGARVRSVALLVSPTTPGEVSADDLANAKTRRGRAPLWVKALERARLLDAPGHHQHHDTHISRSIVALQGPTYLAAQYLAKMMTTEQLAVDGLDGVSIAISANVAGITATKSLEHPLFTAGFLGAPKFGIEIFAPDLTRTLMTLLMVSDLFNPEAPHAVAATPRDKGRAVGGQAVHGGVRTLPWGIDRTIRVGAVLGLGKRPSLAVGLLPGWARPGKKANRPR